MKEFHDVVVVLKKEEYFFLLEYQWLGTEKMMQEGVLSVWFVSLDVMLWWVILMCCCEVDFYGAQEESNQ